jgi:uncharacterized protein YkwD
MLRSSNLALLGSFAAMSSLTAACTAELAQSIPVLPPVRQEISQAASSQAIVQAVHTQINQYRAKQGLPALKLDSRINQQATNHSQAMASGRVPFSHDGFQQRVQTIGSAIPYSSAAENVAYNQGYRDPATQAVQGWLKSPGHLKNIRGQFDFTGIGVVRNGKGEYYLTQIFIKKR